MRSNIYSRALMLLIPLMLLLARPVLAQKYVCMESSQGEWCVELLRSAAPNTVNNFLRYVNNGRYTNNLVHRSVPGFVIQGGGAFLDTDNKLYAVLTYPPVINEFNRSNLRGTVAMAKVGGDPDSATSQWFVNLANNTDLDLPVNGSFTVFANVVYGMSVVDKIAALNVYNASVLLGSDFYKELPLVASQLTRQNLVLIMRAYATDLLPDSISPNGPYHCSPAVPNDALTEFCGNKSATFPVSVAGSGFYEVTLDLIATQPGMIFTVKPGSIKPMSNLPDRYATFDPATNVAIIPSVRVGTAIFDNLQFSMINVQAQQLILQSYIPR